MFPYGLIAYYLSLGLCLISMFKAESRWRYLFMGALILFYVFPLFFSLLPADALFFSRVLLGIICYFYLKWIGFHIR